ncbi:mandelate racemase/muconate lactonizing enzyme family protein [Parapedobacter sp. 10938]|uniref:mandelate racemase/muconate lactonizing enzyme family protein n=1 Tax=Parapedobacter flavus TaxID=3110225 RepID=UPI002DBEC8D5|nr:mandelate racemase/muconate lactonizing enzyme family protein [Parapedobacter sp. 10938]MEC3878527.1 mandelate racemase/muconate lactonizing enzyme family protein [Parapedobacter sp. 10938]
MKIESVDFFYLSMPEVLDIGDGSQDATLVRVRAGGLEGWGECEAAPLPTIAAYVCPMSHSACKPVRYGVEGMPLNEPEDIRKIAQKVHAHSFDLLQADHTLSGIDIALWDLLGKKLDEPVYKLLGYKKAFPKTPYASQLFGDTPEQTYEKAVESKKSGYRAVKFGWGPIGRESAAVDAAHFRAAREGLGQDAYLMIDLGTVWGEDVAVARERLAALKEVNAYWLEEPFTNMALGPYAELAKSEPQVSLAAGEGCNNYVQAAAMLDYAGLGFIQIDTGRIGGITPAKRVADDAAAQGITYVNHTFTSHLALSASLQPYAGLEKDVICEYPVEPKQLALDITTNKILPDANGQIVVPESPGLGMTMNNEGLEKYIVEMEIKVNGRVHYHTPAL